MTNKAGHGPDEDATGSWATESLPMSVRKELLERELKKLGFRKASAHASSIQQQQQPQGGSAHPQAESSDGTEHSE